MDDFFSETAAVATAVESKHAFALLSATFKGMESTDPHPESGFVFDLSMTAHGL